MKFVTLSILFILTACNDSAPRLSELGATNINNQQNISFSSDFYDIGSPDEALEISGRCDSRHRYLEVSFDSSQWNQAEVLFSGTNSDLDCSDGIFTFKMPAVNNYLSFQTGVLGNQGKSIFLRGDLGFTKTSVREALIRSGDFTPPGVPKFNTLSSFDNPQVRLTEKPTDTDIAFYQCQINNGSWTQCFSGTDAIGSLSPITTLAIGEEVQISMRAIDQSGNMGQASTKSIRRGQMGRGFNGLVNGMIKVAEDRFLVYGNFTHYETEVARGFARLHPNGDFDPSYRLGFGINSSGSIRSFDFDEDNNAYLIGDFNQYQRFSNNYYMKLAPTGEVHPTFSNAVFSSVPSSISYEGTDKLRIDFLDNANGINYKGVAFQGKSIRLKEDQSVDTTFNCPSTVKNLLKILQHPSGDYSVLWSGSTTAGSKEVKLSKFNSECIYQNDILTYEPDNIAINDGTSDYTFTDYASTSIFWKPFLNIFTLNNKSYIAGNFNRIYRNGLNQLIPSCIAEYDIASSALIGDSGFFANPTPLTNTAPLQCFNLINSIGENFLGIYSNSADLRKLFFPQSPPLLAPFSTTLGYSTKKIVSYNNLLYALGSRLSLVDPISQLPATQDQKFHKMNLEDINDIKIHENHLYLGGSFKQVANHQKIATNLALIDFKSCKSIATSSRNCVKISSHQERAFI